MTKFDRPRQQRQGTSFGRRPRDLGQKDKGLHLEVQNQDRRDIVFFVGVALTGLGTMGAVRKSKKEDDMSVRAQGRIQKQGEEKEVEGRRRRRRRKNIVPSPGEPRRADAQDEEAGKKRAAGRHARAVLPKDLRTSKQRVIRLRAGAVMERKEKKGNKEEMGGRRK